MVAFTAILAAIPAIATIVGVVGTLSQVVFGFWLIHFINTAGATQLVILGLLITVIILYFIKRIF